MTAIVAVPDVRRKRLVMGGDSAVSYDSGAVVQTGTPKVRRVGGYLLGAAGDGPWFALLDAIDWPKVPSVGYAQQGIARDVRDAAKRLGIDDAEGAAIIGAVIDDFPYLWTFDSALMIDAVPEGTFAAIGSGLQPALGALFERKGSAEARCELALRAAAAYRSDVRGPFTILRY